MKALFAVLIGIAASLTCVGTGLAQEPAESVEKHVCASSIGYSSLDALQQDLLLSAKRMAVDELFGELITASTTVDEFVVTSDEIRSSSLGLIRVDGSLAYTNGNNLAEVCIDMKAYVTAEDRAKFDPVALSKRYCEGNPKLTTGEIQERTRDNAIIQAVIEYDGRLEEIDPDNLRKLMQRVVYSESGFVPDTQTYCTTVSGEVVPIQVLSVLGGADLLPVAELPAASASAQEVSTSTTDIAPVVASVSIRGEPIPFSNDGETLASPWQFLEGKARPTDFVIDDGALRLVAGNDCGGNWNEDRGTSVRLPLVGDFTVQVKVEFDPAMHYQAAGMYLSSSEDPTNRLSLFRAFHNEWNPHTRVLARAVVADKGTWIGNFAYVDTTGFLRITRHGGVYDLAASQFGENWVTLVEDHVMSLPDDLTLTIFAFSYCNDNPTSAKFSDFEILAPQEIARLEPREPAAFESIGADGVLPAYWAWNPGASLASAFRVKDGELTLFAGPGTDMWDNRYTAPRVYSRVSDQFTLETKLDFHATAKHQRAGVYFTDGFGHRVNFRLGGDPANPVLMVDDTSDNTTRVRAEVPYPDSVAYLRVSRDGPLMNFAYSPDGETWTPLLEDYVMSLQDDISLGFSVYSSADSGTKATFSDFALENK